MPKLYAKTEKSLKKTIDKYEITNALLATYAMKNPDQDDDYIRGLREQRFKLRSQLRIKGMLFEEDMDQ